MGRFIISHYQLIPLDRLGPTGAHQEYVKEKNGRLRDDGSHPNEEKDVKGHELVETGAVGQTLKKNKHWLRKRTTKSYS